MRPESLARLQREFLRHALPRLSESSPGAGSSPEELIRPAGRLSAAEAMAVYREGCVARLSEALGETYEATWWVLGDEDFLRLAREYVIAHPSPYANLQHYGEGFPEFLSARPEARELPFVAELARFEREFMLLFHRARTEPARAGRVAEILARGGDARLVFAPEVLFFESPYAVHEVWRHRGEPQDPPPRIDWQRPARLWLTKGAEGEVCFHEATPAQWELLSALREGAGLASALASVAEVTKLSAEEVSRLFAELMRSGAILDAVADQIRGP